MATPEHILSLVALGALPVLLAGCPTTDAAGTGDDGGDNGTGDNGGDNGTGNDGSGDSGSGDSGSGDSGSGDSGSGDDPDGGSDTDGIAYFAYAARGSVAGGGTIWKGGELGNVWWGYFQQKPVCWVMGAWSLTGEPAAEGCPDCDWVFDLTVTGTGVTGPECEELEAYGATEGAWDGLTYSWGWAERFDFYGDGSVYTNQTLLLHYAGTWYPFAWNYGPYVYVLGDSSNFEALSFRGIQYDYDYD